MVGFGVAAGPRVVLGTGTGRAARSTSCPAPLRDSCLLGAMSTRMPLLSRID